MVTYSLGVRKAISHPRHFEITHIVRSENCQADTMLKLAKSLAAGKVASIKKELSLKGSIDL